MRRVYGFWFPPKGNIPTLICFFFINEFYSDPG